MRNADGYDEDFDYTGRDMVALDPRAYRVKPGKTGRHYEGGNPIGECTVGDAAGGILGELQERAGASAGTLRALKVWRKMGDKRVRTHTKGIYLRQLRVTRELIVYVDTPGWAQEFQMFSTAYLQEWNHLCEVEKLPMHANKMTFRVSSRGSGGVAAPGGTAGARGSDVRPSVPLTEGERADVERAVAHITNDEVRRRAYSAMKSVLEWQKSNKTKR